MTGNEQVNTVRSQLATWAKEKTALALILPGGFFLAGIRGELNQGSGSDRFDFVAINEVIRVTIALSLCKSVSIDRQHGLVVVKLGGRAREIMLSEVQPELGTAILSEWLNWAKESLLRRYFRWNEQKRLDGQVWIELEVLKQEHIAKHRGGHKESMPRTG